MPRTANPNIDPRLAPIQVTFRLPWHRKVQLDKIAYELGTTVPQVIIDAVEAVYPSEPLPEVPGFEVPS